MKANDIVICIDNQSGGKIPSWALHVPDYLTVGHLYKVKSVEGPSVRLFKNDSGNANLIFHKDRFDIVSSALYHEDSNGVVEHKYADNEVI